MADTGTRKGADPARDVADPTEDVVDLMLAQHGQIEQLFLLIATGGEEDRQPAFDRLARTLAVHETVEEEIVHPLIRTLPGDNDEQVKERLAEERRAKELLRTMMADGVQAAGFDESLLRLRTMALTHARYEEWYEFPRLRRYLPAERLRALATTAQVAASVAPTHPHPGVESAVANLTLGPSLAIVDRVRDAVREAMGDGHR